MLGGVPVGVKDEEALPVIFWDIVDKGWVDVFIHHGRGLCRGCQELSRWGAGGRLSCLSQVFQYALKVVK